MRSAGEVEGDVVGRLDVVDAGESAMGMGSIGSACDVDEIAGSSPRRARRMLSSSRPRAERLRLMVLW